MHQRVFNQSFVILCGALVLPTVVTWIYFDLLHGTAEGLQQRAYAILKSVQFAMPVAAVWFCARRELWNVRFRGPGLLLGAAFGLAVAVLIHLVFGMFIEGTPSGERLCAMILEKVQGMGLASHIKFILLGCFYAIVHAGLEEYYWRWFVFRWARRMMPIWSANLVSSAGFMLHHILLLGFFFGFGQWPTWVFSLAIAVGGIVWAWLYQRTNNLSAIWLSHALVDAGIFSLGYLVIAQALT